MIRLMQTLISGQVLDSVSVRHKNKTMAIWNKQVNIKKSCN